VYDELDHIDEHQFPVWKSGKAQYIVAVRFVINWNPSSAPRSARLEGRMRICIEASVHSGSLPQIPHSRYTVISARLVKIKLKCKRTLVTDSISVPHTCSHTLTQLKHYDTFLLNSLTL
jgi:hypothetical protein